MERDEVYRLIDGERAYQQAQGLPDQRPTKEWLESMDYYMLSAWQLGMEDAWQLGMEADELDRLAEIRKIAALAVAALEQHGCPPREGYDMPKQAQGVGLDMPDGPGWWGRDSDDTGRVNGEPQFVSQFVRWEVRGDEVFFQWGVSGELTALPVDEFKRIFGGKWYRMPPMPWEVTSPPVGASVLSAQTIRVIYDVLEWTKDDSRQVLIQLGVEKHAAMMQGIDAALAELEQVSAVGAPAGWELLYLGEKIMCACGDPQCYHCIEAIEDALIVYEDVSDSSEATIAIELPEGHGFFKRKGAQP